MDPLGLAIDGFQRSQQTEEAASLLYSATSMKDRFKNATTTNI